MKKLAARLPVRTCVGAQQWSRGRLRYLQSRDVFFVGELLLLIVFGALGAYLAWPRLPPQPMHFKRL